MGKKPKDKSSQNGAVMENVLVRTTKRIKPTQVAELYIRKQSDPMGFEQRHIDDFIGRGVFAQKQFELGDFLLEYAGKRVYDNMPADTDYTYHSVYKGKRFCIDATEEPTTGPMLCRLVNHGNKKKDRNAHMKMIIVDEEPHLCLFSSRQILKGEEILYDYGIKDLPWLNKDTNKGQQASTKATEQCQ